MKGYEEPNYTQVPNSLLDTDMATMSEAELKCTLAIVRKIIGFHKTEPEAVSYTQLEKMTGLSRQAVVDGVQAAINRGCVTLSGNGKRGVNLYTVNFVDQSTQETSGEATSQDTSTELVNEVDTQKKSLKESIKDSDTPDGGQGGASAPATQWGYKVGQVAYWWYEEGQKWVPGIITKFSPKYAYFESKDKNGVIHEVKRGRKKCSPDGKTDDWTAVSELEPLHRIIAVRSYHMEPDQAVDGGRMTELNMHVKDLRVRFGTNGSMVSEAELNAAYGWQKSQGITSPKKRGAIGDMIGAYRETDASRKVTALKVHFPAAGRNCATCGGTGQLLGADNAAVPCPACLSAENEGDNNERAA